jgi:RNA polymerase sigma factor (sigma-70 family)
MRFFTHTLLRFVTKPGSQAAESDVELLARFTRDRDDSAFAAIIDRHGSMVLGVARRILRDPHAAEDVFQATFLALARSATVVRQPGGLPAWLHKTAVRAAVKLAKGQRTTPLETDPPAACPDPLDTLTARELLAAIDQEVQRLPSPLRAAVVACGLEGLSQEEAARLLGWSPHSVQSLLAHIHGPCSRHRRLRGESLRSSADPGRCPPGCRLRQRRHPEPSDNRENIAAAAGLWI